MNKGTQILFNQTHDLSILYYFAFHDNLPAFQAKLSDCGGLYRVHNNPLKPTDYVVIDEVQWEVYALAAAKRDSVAVFTYLVERNPNMVRFAVAAPGGSQIMEKFYK